MIPMVGVNLRVVPWSQPVRARASHDVVRRSALEIQGGRSCRALHGPKLA
jgi:hypothetical protein